MSDTHQNQHPEESDDMSDNEPQDETDSEQEDDTGYLSGESKMEDIQCDDDLIINGANVTAATTAYVKLNEYFAEYSTHFVEEDLSQIIAESLGDEANDEIDDGGSDYDECVCDCDECDSDECDCDECKKEKKDEEIKDK